MPTHDEIATASLQGWAARREGEDEDACPYGEDQAGLRAAWRSGWTWAGRFAPAGGAPEEGDG